MNWKLRYETGVVALVQFLLVTALSFIASLFAIIEDCSTNAGSGAFGCVSSIAVDLTYVVLVAIWFGFVSVLAYAAQDRRDHRLAAILIVAELMVLFVALYINARHFPDIFGLITSLIDSALAIWVILLSIQIIRAKGGRITSRRTRATSSRPRRRIPQAQTDKTK